MSDDLKIRVPEWARNMYNRLLAKIEASGSSGTRSVASSNKINSGGASGNFTTSDGKIVTVTDGIVTSINSEERR